MIPKLTVSKLHHKLYLKCNIYLIQNSPAVKKCVAPKKAIVKKDVKSKVAAKKWLDVRLMAKNLIMTIQVNLCCLLHVSLGFGKKLN